ncbi:MAG TPA: hypothetical protein VH661_05955 [Candidatus Dormibacteraeota bacterium]|jgi:hypothetical protein|nr:hypothetical protein [Candidatus Dormibacteraeota bacterium]
MADEQLMYPRPRAGDFHVHRLLHDIQEDEDLFVEFLDRPDTVLARYAEVDDDAKRLIAAHDYGGLQARGIHPIMIVQFQRHIEWGMRMTASKAAAVSVTDMST